MPVTITLPSLADHLRIERSAIADGTPQHTIVAELLNVATETVERYAGDTTPNSCLNLAVAQLCKYLYDQPNAPKGPGYASAIVNSGAAHLLHPWRAARA